MEKVPFFDLRVINKNEKADILSSISEILDHGRMILGPSVLELEKQVAAYCQRQYGVGVCSGTSALFFGLKSLGIGSGDEVITTAMSWIATANSIAIAGATPVFADIGNDLNIDPTSIEKLITAKTKAIMPVHYTGKICQIDKIRNLAVKYNLKIIEDASQAFGAQWQKRVAGSFGDVGCFSLNPMKILGACGEAGMVVCDNKEVYDRLVALRYNGTINRELCIEPSLNGRIDTLQAVILLRRMQEVPGIIARRKEIASFYDTHLTKKVKIPVEQVDNFDVYYSYTICTDYRDELKHHLDERKVETKVQHLYLMSDQPAYKHLKKTNLPNAEKLVKQIICLPNHEKLSLEQLKYVVNCVNEFFK